jgi:dTDP-L-rhamnose 4-epimerase
VLGYEPQVELEHGLTELAAWLATQIANDHVQQAREELSARGLTL